ncbi:MAG TPA: pantetheine-phosphate adenylyltransferase [Clostridiales bacterium]|nr:pantetheine-phosphate adenylyltransferase [Clostridiales bacterium]HQP69981.1 pantetheine-phosphate adenylyltransferase [Clostridiales bacterium]
MKVAIYPGTFDPLTNGHLDLIERASKLFNKLIVLVGENSAKKPLFNVDERVKMIENSIKHLKNVKVDSNSELTVEYAKKHNVNILVRGVRAFADFEYELQMALMNRKLDENIETVFLMPKNEYSYLNSSLIKGIADFDADIKEFVPPAVIKMLKQKRKKK